MKERYSFIYNKEERRIVRFVNYTILRHYGFTSSQARAYRDYRPNYIAKLLKNKSEEICEK